MRTYTNIFIPNWDLYPTGIDLFFGTFDKSLKYDGLYFFILRDSNDEKRFISIILEYVQKI